MISSGFGFDFDTVTREDQPIAASYQHLVQTSNATRLVILLGHLFPPFKLLPIPANSALENARRTIRNTALSMIHLKQQEGVDKEGRGQRDIAGVMIEENRKNRENGAPNDALTEEEMVNQIMTFLAAGFVSEPDLYAHVVMKRLQQLSLGRSTYFQPGLTCKND